MQETPPKGSLIVYKYTERHISDGENPVSYS
jgi:hypothetical protein